jgi:fatty-acyl-CoA synthase
MVGRLVQVAKSAYQHALILGRLWHTPLPQSPDQEVVYRVRTRITYRQLGQRIGRLASALEKPAVGFGDTVGVLDWGRNSLLEVLFAVPMTGAGLQTVDIGPSVEQIAYTNNRAGASTLLANDEFVGLLEGLRPQLPKVKTLVTMPDRPSPAWLLPVSRRACWLRLRPTMIFWISTRVPRQRPFTGPLRLARCTDEEPT